MNTRSILLALTLSLATQSALAAAGKVLFVAGSVNLERNGSRALKVGDPLDAGDVVVTGEQSRAQILMADGARIALRASSRFRIDEFALPSNVQQPGMAVAVAASGKSVGTLLKGGFSTRDGAVAKSNPAGYEMRTPIGTLGIRGTYYTAVFCRGDCADAPGLPPGQPIADGLYVVVDEGTITFNGRGLSLVLTAPTVEFIPLETSDPQQLTEPPAFLRNDGAGRLEAAGRNVQIAAVNGPLPEDVNDRRSPTGTPAVSSNPTVRAALASGAGDSTSQPGESEPGTTPPERPIVATTELGRRVDLIEPELPSGPRSSLAFTTPGFGQQTPFTASTTQPSDVAIFGATGGLIQFDAPSGPAAGAAIATYESGTAALLGAGSNGATSLRWGRWSTGSSIVTTDGNPQTIGLANASLHWIIGPSFELAPVLPVTGTTSFTLVGGTNPTDTSGHVGALNGAVLSADFTARQVTTTLSLDVNGLNWLATGTGAITTSTVRFGGAFSNVVIDGRVSGAGNFSGFFSAGPNTSDQLNGVGLSYQLADSLNQLGTISGVAAFVPGQGQAPTAPMVSRDLAYVVSGLNESDPPLIGAATNLPAQFTTNGTGNLTSFTAPLARGQGGALFALGTSALANTGTDVPTGIRWGRWETGSIDITVPPAPASANDLSSNSLHWIVGSGYGAAPVMPQTGTASYVIAGGTTPTDTSATAGTLGSASFSADFTNRTVASALSLNLSGLNWFASGSGTFDAGSTHFSGTYDEMTIENLIRGTGTFSGFVTFPRVGAGSVAGAGLVYLLDGSSASLGRVNGAIAFQQGNGTPLTPPALQQRDISVTAPTLAIAGGSQPNFTVASQVRTTAVADYAVDSNFDLTRLLALDGSTPQELVSLEQGTSGVADSNVDPVTLMRWGRWSGGDATITALSGGPAVTLDLAQRSLHWVAGGDAATPPVIPTTGTMSFQLAGWTTPTDRAGNLGTLNNATLDADFTSQLVTSTLDLTVDGVNWASTGVGSIGAQAGLPGHQFSGAYTGSTSPVSAGPTTGTFSGFFTNPGNAPGGPAGAGLTYQLSAGQLGLDVEGAAVFRKP